MVSLKEMLYLYLLYAFILVLLQDYVYSTLIAICWIDDATNYDKEVLVSKEVSTTTLVVSQGL